MENHAVLKLVYLEGQIQWNMLKDGNRYLSLILNILKKYNLIFSILQVFTKLMRRYKYLEKLLEEEMKKVLVYIKGFTDSERVKLARMTALWISNGSVPPAVLNSLINASFNLLIYIF